MKIFCLVLREELLRTNQIRPWDVGYAYFAAIGSWKALREPCDVCEWHWQTLESPLVIEWEPSSKVIGDFSWDGPVGYTFIVKEHVAEALGRMRFECEVLPVTYSKPSRKRNTVPFPYAGPKLFWVECSRKVELDREASRVGLESSCTACGNIEYTFRYNGIVIRKSGWNGEKMFRIATNGWSNATFITGEGLNLLEGAGFSNLTCAYAGEIVS